MRFTDEQYTTIINIQLVSTQLWASTASLLVMCQWKGLVTITSDATSEWCGLLPTPSIVQYVWCWFVEGSYTVIQQEKFDGWALLVVQRPIKITSNNNLCSGTNYIHIFVSRGNRHDHVWGVCLCSHTDIVYGQYFHNCTTTPVVDVYL